MQSFSFAFSAE